MTVMTSNNDSETYNGYANRETWAFNLHWQNDQGLYNETLVTAEEYLNETYGEEWRRLPEDELKGAFYGAGEHIVTHWRDTIAYAEDLADRGEGTPFSGALKTLRMFRDEVGSWWRIDHAEVGEAVRESLDAES